MVTPSLPLSSVLPKPKIKPPPYSSIPRPPVPIFSSLPSPPSPQQTNYFHLKSPPLNIGREGWLEQAIPLPYQKVSSTNLNGTNIQVFKEVLPVVPPNELVQVIPQISPSFPPSSPPSSLRNISYSRNSSIITASSESQYPLLSTVTPSSPRLPTLPIISPSLSSPRFKLPQLSSISTSSSQIPTFPYYSYENKPISPSVYRNYPQPPILIPSISRSHQYI